VSLLPTLKDDLDLFGVWPHPTPPITKLVFPTRDGRPWRDHDWCIWRRRVFQPVAQAVGLSGARPYDLRHRFVSLLVHEGRPVMEVAARADHSPTWRSRPTHT
jgi:hypothetical protein